MSEYAHPIDGEPPASRIDLQLEQRQALASHLRKSPGVWHRIDWNDDVMGSTLTMAFNTLTMAFNADNSDIAMHRDATGQLWMRAIPTLPPKPRWWQLRRKP